MNVLELSEQEIIRRNSMNELRAMGIEPYPAAEYVTNAFSTDIKAEFKDDAEPRKVSVAGRMMTRRVMGKASFIELQDSKGRIQVYITRDLYTQEITARKWSKAEELERLKQGCKELQQRIDEALKEAERPQSEVPEEENTVRAA